jgi:hypothetical protein
MPPDSIGPRFDSHSEGDTVNTDSDGCLLAGCRHPGRPQELGIDILRPDLTKAFINPKAATTPAASADPHR